MLKNMKTKIVPILVAFVMGTLFTLINNNLLQLHNFSSIVSGMRIYTIIGIPLLVGYHITQRIRVRTE